MAVQTATTLRMAIAHLGMIADTSLRQVDGATAAADQVLVGRPVIVTRNDNHTKVTRHMASGDLTALSGKLIGVTMHSHWANVQGFYAKGDAVNVIRVGRVWAITNMNAAPVAGTVAQVAIVDGSPVFTNTGGTAIPGWQFSGEYFVDPQGNKIAEVELTIPQIAAASGA